MVRPEDLGPHVQAIVRALIAYTPEHFTTGFCRVEQAKNQAGGRLRHARSGVGQLSTKGRTSVV